MRRRSTLSQYMRLQNFANEEFGGTGLWAGFGQRFLKPIGLNETKEMLVEKFEQVPIKKTYTCNPQEFDYLDRRRTSSACRCTTCSRTTRPTTWARPRCRTARCASSSTAASRGVSTAFLGEDWGKFTPMDDEMRLYLGVAQDIVVKRTIDKNEQQAHRRQPVQPRSRREVRDRELQGHSRSRSTSSRTCGTSATKSAATPAATSSGNWARTRRFGRARQGEEHLRAGRLPRQAAGPRAKTARPRRSIAQAARDHQERVVTIAVRRHSIKRYCHARSSLHP